MIRLLQIITLWLREAKLLCFYDSYFEIIFTAFVMYREWGMKVQGLGEGVMPLQERCVLALPRGLVLPVPWPLVILLGSEGHC